MEELRIWLENLLDAYAFELTNHCRPWFVVTLVVSRLKVFFKAWILILFDFSEPRSAGVKKARS